MKVLGIDTSTKSLGIAIVENGQLLISCEKILGLRHSQDLIPGIKKLLEKLSFKIEDIDGFAVSLGPGSFTGLRVGITAAKGLAMVTKKPIIGIPTLDVIAQNAYYYPGIICTIMDAKKQKLYAALYKRGNRKLIRISRYLLTPVDRLLAKINKETLFIGDGIPIYKMFIERLKKGRVEFAPPQLWYPKSENIAILGWQKLKSGKKDNPLNLVPLYLHPAPAHIRR